MLTGSIRTWRTAAWAAAVLLAVLSGTVRASTADHREFAALKKKFADGPAVTRACLSCHTKAGEEIHATSHWNWLGDEVEVPGKVGKHRLGKANLLNNFCIGVQSNEGSCAKCHIGFGWKDRTFDFKSQANIDCIACHDGTGEYAKKAPGAAPDAGSAAGWTELALSVGPTSVRTCGACHFAGGGGEGVKHGDLDPSLLEAKKTLDVHMAKDGVGFTCASCHRGEESGHRFKGRAPSVSVDAKNMVTCSQCHGDGPHGRDFAFRSEKEREAAGRFTPGPQKLAPWQSTRRNWHARRIACQTCHIPTFARENSTKLSWDWSQAGRRKPDGRPVTEYDEDGNISYLGIKGAFKWGKNVVPSYRWWNGTSGRYLTGDRFDPSRVLVMNPPLGEAADAASKIWPFKLHEGNQPYDVVNKTLIQPKTYGPKGSGAYWSDYDWEKASRLGMKYAGLPFSGKVGFARTEMYWPVSHMVTQGDQGLSCADCHSRASRLAGVPGVYMPGYDRSGVLDFLGWASALLSLLGVLGHGFLRWLAERGQFERLLTWLNGRGKR